MELGKATDSDKITLDEAGFRWLPDSDSMVRDKLCQGIRGLAADAAKLMNVAKQRLQPEGEVDIALFGLAVTGQNYAINDSDHGITHTHTHTRH